MGPAPQPVISPARARDPEERRIGKADKLACLMQARVRVPGDLGASCSAVDGCLGIMTVGAPKFVLESVS